MRKSRKYDIYVQRFHENVAFHAVQIIQNFSNDLKLYVKLTPLVLILELSIPLIF